MACMRAGQWLNDEVINFYLGLLQEREMANGRPKAPRVHFHNTFFYNKLFTDAGEYQYKSVQRWTTEKRLGYCILDCELILIPVHQDIHWVLAAIDLVNKTVTYYDSLHGQDHTCLVRARAQATRRDAILSHLSPSFAGTHTPLFAVDFVHVISATPNALTRELSSASRAFSAGEPGPVHL